MILHDWEPDAVRAFGKPVDELNENQYRLLLYLKQEHLRAEEGLERIARLNAVIVDLVESYVIKEKV